MFNINPIVGDGIEKCTLHQSINFKELCAGVTHRTSAPLSEEQFMNELHAVVGSRRRVVYLRDMIFHDMWKDKDVRTSAAAATCTVVPSNVQIDHDWQSYKFINYSSDVLKQSILNPLNTNLFSRHPRSSLLSLLPSNCPTIR